MFRSLRYPDYRLFFLGQFLPFCGIWMQKTARSWLVYRLTGDPFYLGLVSALELFPIFLFGFYAGFVIDRHRHLRIIQMALALGAVQAMCLAGLTLSGRIELWHVFVLAGGLGIVNAFDLPTRQVVVGELVDSRDRSNAIALNSFMFNVCRIFGPFAAGILIVRYGEGACFAINAACQLTFLAAIFFIKNPGQAKSKSSGLIWKEIGSGIGYALKTKSIRRLLGLLAVFSMVALPIFILLPVVAAEVLGGGAKTLGFLSALSGVGATLGALVMAKRVGSGRLAGVIVRSVAVFGLSLMGLAFSNVIWLSGMCMWLVGFSVIQVLASANALIQERSSDRYRGRIITFYTMCLLGVNPFGSFVIGVLASRFGVRSTLVLQSLLVLGLAAWNWRSLARVLEIRSAGAGAAQL